MKKKKEFSRYGKIIITINRFRNKDRSVLGNALLYATVHSVWLIIVTSLCKLTGVIKIKFFDLFYLSLNIFFILFIFIISYNGIIKIYMKFFKNWDFKK